MMDLNAEQPSVATLQLNFTVAYNGGVLITDHLNRFVAACTTMPEAFMCASRYVEQVTRLPTFISMGALPVQQQLQPPAPAPGNAFRYPREDQAPNGHDGGARSMAERIHNAGKAAA
jgi:hypothetical protein